MAVVGVGLSRSFCQPYKREKEKEKVKEKKKKEKEKMKKGQSSDARLNHSALIYYSNMAMKGCLRMKRGTGKEKGFWKEKRGGKGKTEPSPRSDLLLIYAWAPIGTCRERRRGKKT